MTLEGWIDSILVGKEMRETGGSGGDNSTGEGKEAGQYSEGAHEEFSGENKARAKRRLGA